MKGRIQQWQEKYSEIHIKPLQLITSNLNPADLPTKRYCTAKEVKDDTPWQSGPSFLKLPRDQWPVSRAFKIKIPEDEIIGKINEPVFRVCALLSYPCECEPCNLAIKPSDSPRLQSI